MMKNSFKGLLALLFLSSCADNKIPLPGDRLSVLSRVTDLAIAESLNDDNVDVPSELNISEWTQAGFNTEHVPVNAKLRNDFVKIWHKDIGTGSVRGNKLLAQPVADSSRIYTMDSRARITAFDQRDGKQLWRIALRPQYETNGLANGGLALHGNVIYAATGYAQIIAIKADTGQIYWRQNVSSPIRSTPTIYRNHVYVITIDNVIHAMKLTTGEYSWKYSGLTEYAGLLGGAGAAASMDMIIAPFSSGEIVALHSETGRQQWEDSLTSIRRSDSVSAISTIRALPVIDQNTVYTISHSGRFFATDFKTGERIWELPIGGTETPMLVGDYLYVLTTDSVFVCINKKTGGVKWQRKFKHMVGKKPVLWSGPVLAGGLLYCVNSLGEIWSFEPQTGKTTQLRLLGESLTLAPIVVNQTLYLLSNSGNLHAFR
jgi:outer membrane protein assembly factor BamB